MDWFQQVDRYCERLDPSFWSEPLNAVSNGAFILAAIFGCWYAARHRALEPGVIVLIALAFLVGVGSFLFHTVATVWAGLADVLPIQLFIVSYFVLAMRRFVGLPWWGSGLAAAAFMALSVFGGKFLRGIPPLSERLNGSEGYLPPLTALVLVGLGLILAGRRGAGLSLVAAGAIFAVSLGFRIVDMRVCPSLPIGTHFMWHLLNGVLLGTLIASMVRFGRPPRRTERAAE